jgi:hypothetical protein
MVAPRNHTAEMTPKALDIVRVNATVTHELQCTVVAYSVFISTLRQVVVGIQLVREDSGTPFDKLPNQGQQC